MLLGEDIHFADLKNAREIVEIWENLSGILHFLTVCGMILAGKKSRGECVCESVMLAIEPFMVEFLR